MSTPTIFESWAIVEVMGHSRYAGKVTEQTVAGNGFIRIDVPATDEYPGFTKLLGTGSIFAITPCAEDVARKAAKQFLSPPMDAIHFPHAVQGIGFDDSTEDP